MSWEDDMFAGRLFVNGRQIIDLPAAVLYTPENGDIK